MLLTLLAGNLNRALPQSAPRPTPLPPEPEFDYPRFNHQIYWQIARYPAPETEIGAGLFRPSFAFPEIEPDYKRADHQIFFQIARKPPALSAPTVLTLFRISYRPPEIEGEYARWDHQTYWQFRAFAPPMCAAIPWTADSVTFTADSGVFTADGCHPPAPTDILPPAAGSMLPGRPPPPAELGKGMGPYKRPGQVFGVQDPVSPFLTSRAEEAARYAPHTPLTQQLPLIELPAPTITDDTDAVVFALVALDELCGSTADVLRGPIRLKIVRRKL